MADGLRCAPCTDHLASELADVPSLVAELDITRARLDRIAEPGAPRGGGEVPLGYRPTVAEVSDVLGMTLTSAARDLALSGRAPHVDLPSQPIQLAAWLLDQREALRSEHRVADELHYAIRVTRLAIDRPPERVYLGPCDRCDHDLYTAPAARATHCGQCQAPYLVEQRRRWLLHSLREHLATAVEISQGIGELYGQRINRKTIHVWHHRERLVAHGYARDNRQPLFRIGDVLDLAERSATRQPTSKFATTLAR
ncbi:hypothetical protein [Pseudonocardia acaciae]|uniref:hypothetical protein n=1 Tax=Pseudonocardia acaciae TaxID=551276 RepID=UPI00048CA857|nr:hypothetical protein [Pseudonocardia acaciae]